MAEWARLLCDKRRKPKKKKSADAPRAYVEVRTELERDYDRVLFSTPVRRMADKTQVFPLDPNDSVRTRLTHSHEVSNLCRSIGTSLAYGALADVQSPAVTRNIPAILAAAGLSHDLGNPPFGHSGERAIQHWFDSHEDLLGPLSDTKAHVCDFKLFEGNAQTFRLLTRLQLINDRYGLDLTVATLAAIMKYPTSSDAIDQRNSATKKYGYFQSEASIVEEVWDATGLRRGHRHPFAFAMEACDDIAYLVLDAEDAVKKGLASFSDLMEFLCHEIGPDDASITVVLKRAKEDHREYRSLCTLSPAELNDISMQKFRVHAIGFLINQARIAFEKNVDALLDGTFHLDLLTVSDARPLCAALKKFDKEHAYRHKSVLAIEAEGFNVIQDLMNQLWYAIENRNSHVSSAAIKATPFAAYAYQRISENYRRIFEADESNLPERYRELQLLTDMIAGMTDSYAVTLRNDFHKFYRS